MGEPLAIDARFEVSVGSGPQRFTLRASMTLRGGVMVLFGRSGCGKSLTLQAVVGTVRPHNGFIRVCGQTMFDEGTWLPPHRRNIGYVPQHHALFPFCSVRDNVTFGLPRARRRRSDAEVDTLLKQLSLYGIQHAMPSRLSGGERQRVALARALVVKPQLLVLDEPFASLDLPSRRRLQHVLRDTLKRYGTPALFVTHDPREAASLADVVLPFERGRSLPQGNCSELLPMALPLDLSAQALQPLAPAADGRRRYRVCDGIVTIPESLVTNPAAPLSLRLHLDARGDSKDGGEQ